MTQINSRSLGDRILSYVMAVGLMIQMSGVVWLFDNYATMVYLLFFIPALYAFFRWRRDLKMLLIRVDKHLLIVLVALLVWVSMSALWLDPARIDVHEWKFAFKVSSLILIYVLGVALLTSRAPECVYKALVGALVVMAIVGALSVIQDYIIIGKEVNSSIRIDRVGINHWSSALNPVVGGIYFGAFSLIAGLLFIDEAAERRIKAVIFICGFCTLSYMLLTFTRTSLVGLGTVTAALCFWKGQTRHHIVLGSIACVGLLVLMVAVPHQLQEYFYRGGIGSWRPQAWQAILHESMKNLYLGVGVNQELQLTVQRTLNGQREMHLLPHAHNFYLQMLYWCGLVGLGLYLLLLVKLLVVGLRNRTDHYSLIALSVLVYFAIVQVFDVYSIFTRPSYYWPCIWLPTGILIGRYRAQAATSEKIPVCVTD